MYIEDKFFTDIQSYDDWDRAFYFKEKNQTLINNEEFIFNYNAMTSRSIFIERMGYCILTKEVIESLANILRNKKVLDACCGIGTLSYYLRREGIDIAPVDIQVKKGKLPIINRDSTEIVENYEVILLVWPPYANPFAAKLVEKMKPGQVLIYQGEGYGGCTGDDRFHNLLYNMSFDSEKSKLLNKFHIQWPRIHDEWFIYTK